MIGIRVGAVVVAARVVDQVYLLLVGKVAYRNAVVAYRVAIDEDFYSSVLRHYPVGGYGELDRVDRYKGLAATVEYQRGGILGVGGDKLRTVHHKTATIVNAWQYILHFKVFLIGAKLGERVFVGLHLGTQRLLDSTIYRL